ncbi:MAG: fumarylacetoacetate hydrolase family protein [Saprospiraceae bacterium]|nr:fumarylacetoacetate hydrolase family protein [Saprospiraceae bacterium]
MKIFCVGRNYIDHARELNNAVPEEPVIFMKPPTALLRNGKPFFIPAFSNDIHYETELIVKISKNGKHIESEFVKNYYDELTVGIDFTARDVQNKLKEKSLPWELAKGFDFSAGVGTWIEFTKEMKKSSISFRLDINRKTVQQGNSSDMIFSIDSLIMYISKFFKLQAGDLIYTGTPAGVGSLKTGDVLEAFVGDESLFYCEIR